MNWLGSSSLDQLISAELSHASVAAVGLEVDDLDLGWFHYVSGCWQVISQGDRGDWAMVFHPPAISFRLLHMAVVAECPKATRESKLQCTGIFQDCLHHIC